MSYKEEDDDAEGMPKSSTKNEETGIALQKDRGRLAIMFQSKMSGLMKTMTKKITIRGK